MEQFFLFLTALGAGAFGAMLGLGGGIILTPVATIALGYEIKEMIPASLAAVVATSCVGSLGYLRKGLVELDLGVYLLLPTVIGAILGAKLGYWAPQNVLAGLFAILMVVVSVQLLASKEAADDGADWDRSRLYVGMGLSMGAGAISALLGVGGGIVQTPMMHLLLKLGMRKAIATSVFLIGATGAASGLVYLAKGAMLGPIVAPVVLGIMVGARIGSYLGSRAPLIVLRRIFAATMILLAIRMIAKAIA